MELNNLRIITAFKILIHSFTQATRTVELSWLWMYGAWCMGFLFILSTMQCFRAWSEQYADTSHWPASLAIFIFNFKFRFSRNKQSNQNKQRNPNLALWLMLEFEFSCRKLTQSWKKTELSHPSNTCGVSKATGHGSTKVLWCSMVSFLNPCAEHTVSFIVQWRTLGHKAQLEHSF